MISAIASQNIATRVRPRSPADDASDARPGEDRGRRAALDALRRGRSDPASLHARTAAASARSRRACARTRSRFGGRLEPFFRLRPASSTRAAATCSRSRAPRRSTAHAAPARGRPPRSTPPRAPATPSRRLFETAEPHPAGLQPALQRARAARRRRPAAARRTPTSSRSGSSCCSPPGFAPQLAACAVVRRARPPRRLLRRGRRRRLQRLRGVGASRSARRRTRSWPARSAARWPRRPRPPSGRCARPSGRSPRPSSTTRTSAARGAQRDRIARHGRPPLARSGSTTSPRARARCATCSAARARTSRR